MDQPNPRTTEHTQFEADSGDTLNPGTVLDGKYQIEGLLGRGGMGIVYKGKHLELGHSVAIKTLRPWMTSDADAAKRFQREAQIVSGLRHKNIVSVYTFGEVTGMIYMAMEFVKGVSLHERISERGRLSPNDVAQLLLEICEGMEYAHANSVLHRDLKPSNVVIVTDASGANHAKIVDFGLARIVAGDDRQRLTQTGDILGDPNYMSPEQCQGQFVDARSDIYSFGCLMYEAFSGKPPFLADVPVQTLFKQIQEQPQPFAKPLEVPASWEAITLKCMAKKREDRFQSFAELATVISRVQADPSYQLSAPPPITETHRFLKPLIAVTCVAVIVILGALAYFNHQTRNSGGTTSTSQESADLDERLQAKVREVSNQKEPRESDVLALIALAQEAGKPQIIRDGKTRLLTLYYDELRYADALRVAKDVLRETGLSTKELGNLMFLAGTAACSSGHMEDAERLFDKILADPQITASLSADRHYKAIYYDAHAKQARYKTAEALRIYEDLYHQLRRAQQSDPSLGAIYEETTASLIQLLMAQNKMDEAGKFVAEQQIFSAVKDDKVNSLLTVQMQFLLRTRNVRAARTLVQRTLARTNSDWEKSIVLTELAPQFSANGFNAEADELTSELRALAKQTKDPRKDMFEMRVSMNELHSDFFNGKYQRVLDATEPLLKRLVAKPGNTTYVQRCVRSYEDSLYALHRPAAEGAPIKKLAQDYYSQERLRFGQEGAIEARPRYGLPAPADSSK